MRKLVTTELRQVRLYWKPQYAAARSHIGVAMRRDGSSSPCRNRVVCDEGAAPSTALTGSVDQGTTGEAEEHVLEGGAADQCALGHVPHARHLGQRGVTVVGVEEDAVGQHLLALRQLDQRRRHFLVLAGGEAQLHHLAGGERLDQL